MSVSAAAFYDVVWPVMSRHCGGGELRMVELDPFARDFDMLAGIDAWQLCHSRGMMRGIASRVQFGTAWDSFTVRLKRTSGASTEFAKRIESMLDSRAGWLHPALTVQAYVSSRTDGELLHACMTRTDDMYHYILDNEMLLDVRENPQDGNLFTVVWCDDLRDAGIEVRSFTSNGTTPIVRRRRSLPVLAKLQEVPA